MRAASANQSAASSSRPLVSDRLPRESAQSAAPFRARGAHRAVLRPSQDGSVLEHRLSAPGGLLEEPGVQRQQRVHRLLIRCAAASARGSSVTSSSGSAPSCWANRSAYRPGTRSGATVCSPITARWSASARSARSAARATSSSPSAASSSSRRIFAGQRAGRRPPPRPDRRSAGRRRRPWPRPARKRRRSRATGIAGAPPRTAPGRRPRHPDARRPTPPPHAAQVSAATRAHRVTRRCVPASRGRPPPGRSPVGGRGTHLQISRAPSASPERIVGQSERGQRVEEIGAQPRALLPGPRAPRAIAPTPAGAVAIRYRRSAKVGPSSSARRYCSTARSSAPASA